MAATAWKIHDVFKEMVGNGFIDLDLAGSTFIITLWLNTSDVDDVTVAGYATATNEVATNFGYTQGTKTLTTPAWTRSGSTCKWDESGADPVWTASGGSITARFAAIHDDTPTTPTADPIVCSTQLDTGDVTATDGNTFTIAMHTSGIFTLT